MRKFVIAILILTLGVALSACGGAEATELKKLRIGTTPPIEPEVLAGKDALAKLGYELETVILDTGPVFQDALINGDVEALLNPHQPAIDAYNASHGTDLVMLRPYIHKVVFGMFSDKYRTPEEIPEGATVVVPMDAANKTRAMFLLQEVGLIKLIEGVTAPSELDVAENPKNLQFHAVRVQEVVRSLPDAAACLCAKLFITAADWIPSPEDVQIRTSSDDMEKFQTGFVVRKESLGEQWVKDLIAAYTTEEQAKAILKLTKGAFVPAF